MFLVISMALSVCIGIRMGQGAPEFPKTLNSGFHSKLPIIALEFASHPNDLIKLLGSNQSEKNECAARIDYLQKALMWDCLFILCYSAIFFLITLLVVETKWMKQIAFVLLLGLILFDYLENFFSNWGLNQYHLQEDSGTSLYILSSCSFMKWILFFALTNWLFFFASKRILLRKEVTFLGVIGVIGFILSSVFHGHYRAETFYVVAGLFFLQLLWTCSLALKK